MSATQKYHPLPMLEARRPPAHPILHHDVEHHLTTGFGRFILPHPTSLNAVVNEGYHMQYTPVSSTQHSQLPFRSVQGGGPAFESLPLQDIQPQVGYSQCSPDQSAASLSPDYSSGSSDMTALSTEPWEPSQMPSFHGSSWTYAGPCQDFAYLQPDDFVPVASHALPPLNYGSYSNPPEQIGMSAPNYVVFPEYTWQPTPAWSGKEQMVGQGFIRSIDGHYLPPSPPPEEHVPALSQPAGKSELKSKCKPGAGVKAKAKRCRVPRKNPQVPLVPKARTTPVHEIPVGPEDDDDNDSESDLAVVNAHVKNEQSDSATEDSPQKKSRKRVKAQQMTATERNRQDKLLLKLKKRGLTYKEIQRTGHFQEQESTLRGRMRLLKNPTYGRIRKPKWSAKDTQRLNDIVGEMVEAARARAPQTKGRPFRRPVHISWQKVADWFKENRGDYPYGAGSCSKKWYELNGDDGTLTRRGGLKAPENLQWSVQAGGRPTAYHASAGPASKDGDYNHCEGTS